jgi:hypothetical protein
MKDPIDVLGVHPSGAYPKQPDPRDYPWHPNEIAQASIPFVWKEVDNPDIELCNVVGDPSFRLPTKNQGVSGSCGGQATSYEGQVLSKIYKGDASERSAKYPYSQVYVPGGGSAPRALAGIALHQGFGLESLTPSYEVGSPPSEAFMERVGDITAQARLSATMDQMSLAYSFPRLDLESVAQAIFAGNGGLLLLHGTNNGTWLSTVPKPPTAGEDVWTHYMAGLVPGIYQGQKGIWAKQSWGPSAGMNGWQFLNADYFASGAILDCMVYVFNPRPNQPPQHTFNTNLHIGETGPDVTALQQLLAYDGEFNLAPTSYYGQITAQAVLKFQIKYQLATPATLAELGGDVVGPATRAKLNSLV